MSSLVPQVVSRFVFAVVSILTLARPLQTDADVVKLASFPPNSNPGEVFQAPDGCLYGVLRETNLPNPKKYNGAVYRISPQGSLTYLHQFAYVRDLGVPSVHAVDPEQLALGKDGSLYGLTRWGGAAAGGVFYRLSMTGDFRVLKEISLSEYYTFAYMSGPLVQGPDDAFYTRFVSNFGSVQVVRLGYDGSFSSIYERPWSEKGNATLIASPTDPDALCLYWMEPQTNDNLNPTIFVRTIRASNGEVLENREIKLGGPSYGRQIVRVTANEVLIRENEPMRFISVDPQGQATTLVEFSRVPPADLETNIITAHGMGDGTIYFTVGQQEKGDFGLDGGTKIYRLNRNGTFFQVADLDGYPLASWCEGLDGHFYGLSWGPAAVDPGVGDAGEIMEGMTPMRHRVSTMAAPSAESAPSLIGKKARRGFFRYVPKGTDANVVPFALVDRYSIPARLPAGSKISMPVLRNDRDPEKKPLQLLEVGVAQHGSASVVPAQGRTPAQVAYVPANAPYRSDRFDYTIRDEGGKTAIGQVFVRGDVKGVFTGKDLPGSALEVVPSVAIDELTVKVSPTGKFNGTLKVNGVRVSLAGSLDYEDQAAVSRQVKGTANFVSVRLAVESPAGVKQLSYTVEYLGQEFSGILPIR